MSRRGLLVIERAGSSWSHPEEWLCKLSTRVCYVILQLLFAIPSFPDKLLSTSVNCSIKEVCMRAKQHQQASNTDTPYNGHFKALSTHPARHRNPPAQSSHGTFDPVPGKHQAHTHRSPGRALCRACEPTWHADHQRGDLYRT
jgi:hypothetical protein